MLRWGLRTIIFISYDIPLSPPYCIHSDILEKTVESEPLCFSWHTYCCQQIMEGNLPPISLKLRTVIVTLPLTPQHSTMNISVFIIIAHTWSLFPFKKRIQIYSTVILYSAIILIRNFTIFNFLFLKHKFGQYVYLWQ